jgi:hypothetical protein
VRVAQPPSCFVVKHAEPVGIDRCHAQRRSPFAVPYAEPAVAVRWHGSLPAREARLNQEASMSISYGDKAVDTLRNLVSVIESELTSAAPASALRVAWGQVVEILALGTRAARVPELRRQRNARRDALHVLLVRAAIAFEQVTPTEGHGPRFRVGRVRSQVWSPPVRHPRRCDGAVMEA